MKSIEADTSNSVFGILGNSIYQKLVYTVLTIIVLGGGGRGKTVRRKTFCEKAPRSHGNKTTLYKKI